MATRIKTEAEKSGLTAQLEADLLAGNFRPAEWLKQSDLEQTYQANRFDVRMALIELRARRLLVHVPNRGFRVIDLSDDERAKLVDTRTILECAAARMVAKNATTDDVTELTAISDEFEKQIETADQDTLRETNNRFHDRLYQISGNSVLVNEIKELRSRGLPGIRSSSSWRTINGVSRSNEDHKEMIRLIAAGDSDGLEALVQKHLNNWRQKQVA